MLQVSSSDSYVYRTKLSCALHVLAILRVWTISILPLLYVVFSMASVLNPAYVWVGLL